MTKRILVPIDGSPLSLRALEFVLEEYDDVTIVALHVLDPTDPGYSSATSVDVRTEPPRGSEEWYERADAEEDRLFEKARERTDEYDAELITDHSTGDPAREIVAAAEEHNVDRIVMGSHGRTGPTRILLGSVAETVVRRSPVSVTVVRDESVH
ncbi:universal stress protein [Natrarchaeobius oligotrophus]|uniref:Universal stress protein n=1 Tax=Natrarchaeobius chitinivorans TaxID=1679083 RepID=A0A3N6MWZ4_NATCH|nr:universal stress protein [Natrarchaeobius chitinivorans]RQH02531.1 universal stress protein [Natrarchaeobius chitinivorans]